MSNRWLRDLSKWLLYPFPVRIKAGPLKGYRWIASSGVKFIRGTYEPEKTEAIQRITREGDIALDVGAHVGYFSVLLSKCVGETGHVFSFEPRGINRAFLKRHLDVNGCTNVTVLNAAVGDRSGNALLETRTGTGTGRLSATGDLPVPLTSIDEFCSRNHIAPPSFIKIDIEGGEVDALKGAANTIRMFKPRIVLATHGDQLDADCNRWLGDAGYVATDVGQVDGDKETIFIHPANP